MTRTGGSDASEKTNTERQKAAGYGVNGRTVKAFQLGNAEKRKLSG